MPQSIVRVAEDRAGAKICYRNRLVWDSNKLAITVGRALRDSPAWPRLVAAIEGNSAFCAFFLPHVDNPRSRAMYTAALYDQCVDFILNCSRGRYVRFDEQAFEREFQALAIRASRPTYRECFSWPIWSLQYDGPPVTLGGGVQLRQPDLAELTRWMDDDAFGPQREIAASRIQQSGAVFEYAREVPLALNWSYLDVQRFIHRVEGLASLLWGARAFVPFFEAASDRWGRTINRRDVWDRLEEDGSILRLDAERLSEFRLAWSALCKANRREVLAFDRWVSASERTHDLDALLDYWILLEALFGEGLEEDIKRRVCHRVAVHIRELPERRELFGRLLDSYQLRSAFVHGNDRDLLRYQEQGRDLKLKATTQDCCGEALRSLLLTQERWNLERLDTAPLDPPRRSSTG